MQHVHFIFLKKDYLVGFQDAKQACYWKYTSILTIKKWVTENLLTTQSTKPPMHVRVHVRRHVRMLNKEAVFFSCDLKPLRGNAGRRSPETTRINAIKLPFQVDALSYPLFLVDRVASFVPHPPPRPHLQYNWCSQLISDISFHTDTHTQRKKHGTLRRN